MPLLNPNEPMGLPPGTLRGIGFLAVIFSLCILTWVGKVSGEAFLGIAIVVVRAYFDAREDSKPKEPEKPSGTP